MKNGKLRIRYYATREDHITGTTVLAVLGCDTIESALDIVDKWPKMVDYWEFDEKEAKAPDKEAGFIDAYYS